jgi:asparagine synthase (glutamine-hydrolysing)
MPGIVGIITKLASPEYGRNVKAMRAAMQHESFYTSGVISDPELGVFAGWIAHENSFADKQVFQNEQKDVTLVFSGECFVDAEAKQQLKQNGHQFAEVGGDCLVHLYEEQGKDFFKNLNGIFSGLLIDRRQQKAILFNDRYGLDRIYWHETSHAFYFANEAKALLCVLPETQRFDQEGIVQFLAVGCTLEDRTLYQGVFTLPGGSKWTFKNGICDKACYFSPAEWESQSTLSMETFESEFQETFRRILPGYTESESKLGISLTAGLDTRMVMACLPGNVRNQVSYTYSGEGMDTLDARLAAQVAAACGLEHQILRIGPDFFADFAAWADRTVYATDGRFGITGTHELYLNAHARRLATIRLTGVFGGEILRGVSTFKPIGLSTELLNPDLRPLVRIAEDRFCGTKENPVTFAAFREIPSNIGGSVLACRSQIGFRSPYLDNELVALAYRMPVGLRRSCDSAVRFVRKNSQALSDIPTDMGYLGKASGSSAVLRRVIAKVTFKLDYINNEGLPNVLSKLDPLFRHFTAGTGVFGHHKYLHYRSWFRKELATYVTDSLTSMRMRRNHLWNEKVLKQLSDDHLSGRKNYVQEINAVLTLDAVERLLFKNCAQ